MRIPPSSRSVDPVQLNSRRNGAEDRRHFWWQVLAGQLRASMRARSGWLEEPKKSGGLAQSLSQRILPVYFLCFSTKGS